MAGRYSDPVPQYLDDNTSALAGGKLYFYVTGTTTPQATYSDSGLTTPNSNPVLLDSAGRIPEIYAAYDKTFRVVLKTSADVTVWTKDNVQFADIQELVTLANRLQAQIDSIETVITNSNPIKNPTAEVVSPDDFVTLTGSFLPHVVVGVDGRVSGTVSAGTMQAGSLSGCGSVSRQAKMAGVTGDASSVIEWRFRVSSAESRRFANKICSISAVMRQESGLTATATIALYKANAADNFSAVTLVGSTTASVTSTTNTGLEYAGLALGDVSNGIELIIKVQPGGSFTTKDFYLTDVKLEVGATATTFTPPSLPEVRNEAVSASNVVYRDSGTANAIVIATGEATSLYDGLVLTVLRTATSTGALTLTVDGNSAATVRHRDGTVCGSEDTVTGRFYSFRYDSGNSRFVLENPEKPTYYSARAWVMFNGTGTVAIRASGNVTSITDNAAGDYTVNLTVALSDANYAPVVSCSSDGLFRYDVNLYGQSTLANGSVAPTTSAFRFTTYAYSGSASTDSAYISAVVFR